jgi:hypothetical protein
MNFQAITPQMNSGDHFDGVITIEKAPAPGEIGPIGGSFTCDAQ